MIIKVQVSLATNHKKKMVLVYNMDKTIMREFPMNKDVVDVMNGRSKAYFNANHRPDGILEIFDEIETQNW